MSARVGTFLSGAQSSHRLARAFPTPQMLYPHSAGVDISDASIRYLALAPEGTPERVLAYGVEPLPEGVVVGGAVHDVAQLAAILGRVKRHLHGVGAAHAALPEEAAYVFSMSVPGDSPRDQILNMIEFELPDRVPIPPNAAVFDFDVIDEHAGVKEIGVAVFPRELAQAYADAFMTAGIELLSLELEARSIARAVTSTTENDSAVLLADFGRARTGFAVLKKGIPIFTSTVGVGGEAITRALMKKLSLTAEAAETFTDEEGLLAVDAKKSAIETITAGVSAFADEVARHYHYWDTRRNDKGERMTPVSRVLLGGGSANIKGLADFVASRVQAPVAIPNVWTHVASFEEYIPPIDRKASLQYATAIGLALRALS